MKLFHAISTLIFLSQFILSCRCFYDYENTCPYDLRKVVEEAGLDDFQPIQPVCWRQRKDKRPLVIDEVILLGKRDKNFVLLKAYKHPLGYNNWNRSGINVHFIDGYDEMTYLEQEYSSFPTSKNVKKFIAKYWDQDKDYTTVFEGKKELKSQPEEAIDSFC